MLTDWDYQHAADRLGCDVAAIMAVAEVESKGSGFNDDGSIKTLFEAHIFSRLTEHRYDGTNSNISCRKWDRTKYGKTWQQEQYRLRLATSIDQTAALKSASWGAFQIMGFNHEACGFSTVQEFVTACTTEVGQLLAFMSFIKANPQMLDALRSHDWAAFARLYNGPDYALNKYDIKLASAFAKHSAALAA